MTSNVTSTLPMELFKLDDSIRALRLNFSCDRMERSRSEEGGVSIRTGITDDLPADIGDNEDFRVIKSS